MLYLSAHVSIHLMIDTALKDMVIELLLDIADRIVFFVVPENIYSSV